MSPLRIVFAAALAALLPATGTGQGLPSIRVPAENPITTDKVNLGNALFWDEQLSSTRIVACGTCHIPSAGGSDPRSLGPGSIHPGADGVFGTEDDVVGSRGVVGSRADGSYRPTEFFGLRDQVTERQVLSMINAVYHRELLSWDGRSSGAFVDPLTGAVALSQNATLETQALEPLLNEVEMAHQGRDWPDVVARITESRPLALATDIPAALDNWLGNQTYLQLFQRAFGTAEITPVRIAMALATYQRTLIADGTPYDAFVSGQRQALTQQERRGLGLFTGRAQCIVCHPVPLFSRLPGQGGPQSLAYFNIGLRPPFEDRGRAAVSGRAVDEGAFKIPSLRNVGLRAPYFHNGKRLTLTEVVDFYDRGGDFEENQAPQIRPLGLTDTEKQAIVAFLQNGLTDPRVAAEQAPFDRPRLYTEGERMPQPYGAAAAGSAGIAPRLIAEEPPFLGNPNMTVAVADALGGASALLMVGTSPQTSGLAVLGVPLHVDLTTSPYLVVVLASLGGNTPGGGYGSLNFALPTDPVFAGVSLYVQGLVFDPGAAQGLAGTAGVKIALFAPR